MRKDCFSVLEDKTNVTAVSLTKNCELEFKTHQFMSQLSTNILRGLFLKKYLVEHLIKGDNIILYCLCFISFSYSFLICERSQSH